MHSLRTYIYCVKYIFSRCRILFLLLTIPMSANEVKRFNNALDGLVNNNFSMVDKAFLKTGLKSGNDQLLALYELGSFYSLSGNFKQSAHFFDMADSVSNFYESNALISMNAIRRYSSAVLTNDSATRYEGFGYDKVMSRTFNAMNYFFLGDLEGAQVELKKAEEYQRLNREVYKQKKYNNKLMSTVTDAHPKLHGVDLSYNESVVNAAYDKMFDQVKNISNSFESAFTYFLASQFYLAQGVRGIDDAMVSIKRAYELMPNVPCIQSSYLDIAKSHSWSAYNDAKTKLGLDFDDSISDRRSMGSVVVCFAAGRVPNMELLKIPFMISDNVYTLTFPVYRHFDTPQMPLVIHVSSDVFKTTAITDIRCLAIKSLQERMPELIGRSVLGAIVKAELQSKIREHAGPFAGLIAGVTSLSVPAADCRSWLSLPAELQIAKFNLNVGSNKLMLSHGCDWIETLTLNIKAGCITLIFVRSFPGFRRVDIKSF